MKKVLLILGLLVSLSACDFQSREDFQEELSANKPVESSDIDMPAIKYVSADNNQNLEPKSNNADANKDDSKEKLDFISLYGKGKVGENMNPNDCLGNIVDTKIGESQIGISIRPSIQESGGISSILSYDKGDGIIEREYGPVAGFNNLATVVTYDEIESESGPMLLVSQVSVDNTQSYSTYYLFNKYMSLMDYLIFRNSTDNIITSVERLGDMVEVPNYSESGSIDEAIKHRMETEQDYLPSLLDVYKVKSKAIKSLVGGKETDLGSLPDIKDERRLLLIKTTSNPDNMGMNIDIEK